LRGSLCPLRGPVEKGIPHPSRAFRPVAMEELGTKAKGHVVVGENGPYPFRESETADTGHFDAKIAIEVLELPGAEGASEKHQKLARPDRNLKNPFRLIAQE
jgi:hypothetical protein